MKPITTSLFELFKIGPGPSSSHTIGPMKAGYDFITTVRTLPEDILARAVSIKVHLYGSLSATGRGHGTDRAVLAGLLGANPRTCSAEFMDGLDRDNTDGYRVAIGSNECVLTWDDIVFDAFERDSCFSNTLSIRLFGDDQTLLFEREYYSVGGGFIQWKGQKEEVRGMPAYPYATMEGLKKILRTEKLRLHEVILANEKALTGASEGEISAGLDHIITTMEEAVDTGIGSEGILPGPIGLHRKAPVLYRRACKMTHSTDHLMVALSAYAFGASEENAAGHRIVTAPTAGSSGVMPAVVYVLKNHRNIAPHALREGLMAAAAVGFLARHNASIAGADVGCQGEIGVASAMAASFLAYALGYRFQVTENAAEIALEHHLGLTCDPVLGYVQIPCIERNAMGALKAYTAFLIASAEIPGNHKVDLDQVIRAMAETGRDMCTKYKETSLGGLAQSVVQC
ncbi:L-serine ammonia-lyase [Desulfoplanes formicivorans]|uniref:L-serine dehydratase n=1 Tax=Desulfoplanes formicivorans TaxID=1592317 RepID=A0A194ALX8_9BACT|nr:L-serine ammonia-lyase [Desulfoplanes formicivorans]GAU09659.1 serine dehydratase [Desulfoplanes formicivorans]